MKELKNVLLILLLAVSIISCGTETPKPKPIDNSVKLLNNDIIWDKNGIAYMVFKIDSPSYEDAYELRKIPEDIKVYHPKFSEEIKDTAKH